MGGAWYSSDTMQDCVFCKVVNKEFPSTRVYEDDVVIAFNDIHPVAPIHILVVPKEHMDDFYNVANLAILPAIMNALKKLIDTTGLMGKGYRIETNGGGAQLVNHLHFHLIGPIGHAPKA